MFPNMSQLLDPLIPHAVSARDIAIRSVSAICERLDDIHDAVASPKTIEERKTIGFSLADGGTYRIDVPVGETWELESVTVLNTGAGAGTARYRIYDGDVTSGNIVWGGSASADMPLVIGGGSVRIPGGSSLTLIYDFGVVRAVGRIQFVIRRPEAKVKGRFAGAFEKEIDYEYGYAQVGMNERHFATTAMPHSMDNHKGSDPYSAGMPVNPNEQ
jgi:hypothetical protein